MIESKTYGGFKVSIDEKNFEEQDLQKLQMAAEKMAEAIGSEEFKKFVIDYSYSVLECTGFGWWKSCANFIKIGFRFNNDKTQSEILEHILSGAETLSPEIDREADVSLQLDKKNKRGVLGYTYPNTATQWIYNWFFKSGTIDDVAGNIAHEWCHKMGYGHEYSYNALRAKTVPYAVGYFVRDYISRK